MKITEVPHTKNVIWYFSTQVRMDLAKINNIPWDYTIEDSKDNGDLVGVVNLCVKDDADVVTNEIAYHIYRNDDFYKNNHPYDWHHMPLATVGYNSEGVVTIHINSVVYRLYLDHATNDIAVGVIAHEVGHILAGHLDNTKRQYRQQHFDPDEAAIKLLNGENLYHDSEREASLYAVEMVGLAPVLACAVMISARAFSMQTRIEFSNQMYNLLKEVTDPAYRPPKMDYTNARIKVYDEEELAEIRKRLKQTDTKASVESSS